MNPQRELVTKYNRQAPRYTSYPSALHFKEMAGTDHAVDYIVDHNQIPRSLSLYIHLPFCASLCWYCGCTKVITRRQGDSRTYLDHLYTEMEHLAGILNDGNEVVQLHFGGGTPTFLTPDELRELGGRVRTLFQCAKTMEFAVEIDPRRLTRDHVAALAETGCNRASLGVQDVQYEVQQAINRIQPMSVNKQVVTWLHESGIHSINIDLIYGLPLQTHRSFESTLNEVKTLDPDRFAIFNYAHIPWMMPSQKLFDRYPMPDMHEKFEMLKMMIHNLTQSGYDYIGMDHFTKADDELAIARKNGTLQRNFQGYSTHSNTDIYGFGMSSISQIGDAYIQTVKDLDKYYHLVESGSLPYTKHFYLSLDDKIRRYIIMRLMCDLEVNFVTTGEYWNLDATKYFSEVKPALDELTEDKLIIYTENGFQVTETGRMFLRNIATVFDAYMNIAEKSGNYSKTV